MSATVIAERTLTLAGVRAEMYASHASVEADPMAADDPPDTLTQAMHHEAYFILDRYSRREGDESQGRPAPRSHRKPGSDPAQERPPLVLMATRFTMRKRRPGSGHERGSGMSRDDGFTVMDVNNS